LDDTIEEDHEWRVQFTSPSGLMNPRPLPDEVIEVRWGGRIQYATLIGNWLYLAGAVAVREGQVDFLMTILRFSYILLSEPASVLYEMSVLKVCIV
jgi:hypothetical protein